MIEYNYQESKWSKSNSYVLYLKCAAQKIVFQTRFSSVQRVQFALYLAMLYPERGTQRQVVCPSAPSVCMSVRPSLTLRYRDHTMILTIYSTHYSIRAKELFTIYANLPMD